jgi:hypothetical protein
VSIAEQRKRLAKLEARRRRVKRDASEVTEVEVARAIGWVLTCAVEGRGGDRMLEAWTMIGRRLAAGRTLSEGV